MNRFDLHQVLRGDTAPHADTDAALTEAFLKVTTAVLRLLTLQRFEKRGQLQQFVSQIVRS